jgi:MFS family permease
LAAADAAASHGDGDVEKEDTRYRRGVAALAAANCAHFFSVCSIFPYAGFLAVDNGWAVDIDAAGYVAGWLATFTLVARIPTSTLWGLAADRWGSKICLEVSLFAIAVGSPLFGLSSALWGAIASRALFLGALNGWPTLTGLMVAEISGEERQGAALSKIISVGGFMGLIGPAVGGWTYDSVPFMPRALPPNLIAAAICLVALGAVHVWYPSVGSGGHARTGGDGDGDGGGDGDGNGDGGGDGTASNHGSVNAEPSAGAEVVAAGSGDARLGVRGESIAAPVSTWHALCAPPLPLVLVYRLLVGLYLYLIFDGTVGGSNAQIHPLPPPYMHMQS